MIKDKKLEMLERILKIALILLSIKIIFPIMLDCTSCTDYFFETYQNQCYNEYIFVEGKTNEYILQNINDYMSKNIPEEIRYFFFENGGMIYVTDENLTTQTKRIKSSNNNNDKRRVLAYFRYDDTEYSIHLSNILADTKEGTLEHEFGHYLDYYYDDFSETNIFKEIFDEEYPMFKKNIDNDEHYSTQSEYFAECFSVYLENEKQLIDTCPKTYIVIKIMMCNIRKSLAEMQGFSYVF